ncbi:dipeptide ABC transporter ATP-binding protein [Auraticoccus sp. F435]|uniref:Dipeptide ABC transporter ATP-binding protein n=1 Tax=Auraticoccus cholistanensis TaxID=2656650 RepID=A0A6A9USG3_9ACTN|nr:ABC transporter ATP-binding protein [Auraticoccus cholistanensis]MVA75866.1 dipeptide ABC transporter ATP-binding protein [Auraticoccus cholistanensis]
MTERGQHLVEERGPLLRVRDLRVHFAEQPRPAVDGLSLELAPGEVLALVGESGSGKSVTARSLLGLLPGTATVAGSVRWQVAGVPDREWVGATESQWRQVRGRCAAMVFQEPQTALNPVRTVGWQLAEAVRAHTRTDRRSARRRAVELLDLVGIPEPGRRVDSFPHQLSGGQKQRVVIALALAQQPAALVADEPTTALDVTVQRDILQLLADLRDRLGTAVLLITHSMGVVASLADRVQVVHDGRHVETGGVHELFDRPQQPYTRLLLSSVPRLPTTSDAGAPAPAAAVDTRAVDPREVVVEADGLDVEYPGRFGRASTPVLHDVTFAVRAGEVLGVVGESGSGKSTLTRVVLGQLPALRGEVRVGGQRLAGLSSQELRRVRRGIGVVQQDPASSLDPRLSVADCVAEPLQLHRWGGPALVRGRVAELLESVSLPRAVASRLPHELSGGQRQRVAVARALALRPSLLVADEPTSALDVTVQASVLALLARLQAEQGFACLFVSHDLAVVHQVSDRVLVLRHGRVVEQGDSGSVLTRPVTGYARELVDAVPVPDPRHRLVGR